MGDAILEPERNVRTDLFEWSDPLVKACNNFVSFKDNLDTSNRATEVYDLPLRKIRQLFGFYDRDLEKKPSWFRRAFGALFPNPRRPRAQATAIMPSCFVEAALPFSDNGKHVEPYEIRLIRPQLVLSGSYNQYNRDFYQDIQDVFPDEVMNSLESACFKYTNGIPDTETKYTKIGRLPLYVAIEGKNRLELFKRYRKYMYARVSTVFFPEPDELILIRLKPFNIWMLDYRGQKLTLPFSEITLPILREYGVCKEKIKWDFFSLLKLRRGRIKSMSFQMHP
ncbi:hypothetical protein [Erwinia oleae]|uniref:hypothetical protein n=1 Tax=Erwinia oleae TaxID=796334 RepID=UPI00054DE978|nr:hypothetical protein [Erwinia oleae]